MEDLIWNDVPKKRQAKTEKFDTPVVSLNAIEKIGAGRKFTFNKAAQTLLNIVGKDRVSFGFTKDGQHIYLRKADGEAGLELTQTCTISDKKTYEFIAKQCGLNIEVENHFDVVGVVNTNYFELKYRPMVGEMEVVDFLALGATPTDEFKSMDLGEIVDETVEVEDTVMNEVDSTYAEQEVLEQLADEAMVEDEVQIVEEMVEETIDNIVDDNVALGAEVIEEEVEEEDEW